jgi:uncharacterized membrane protein
MIKLSPGRINLLYLIGSFLIIIGLLLIVNWVLAIDKLHPDFGQEYRAAKRLMGGGLVYEGSTNNHPPFNALLFIPFAFLPYQLSLQIWTLLSVALYLGIGYWIARYLQISLPPVGWIMAIGIALCWYPFQVHLALGQISLLVIACLISGWVLLRQEQDYLSGLLFALAFLIKLFPGLVFLFLLLRGKWRALATAVGCPILSSFGANWFISHGSKIIF